MSTSPIVLWAEDAIGYRPDDEVPDWQRTTLLAVVALGAVCACVLTVSMLNRGGPPRVPGNTSSIIRLDDFTQNAHRTARNTMPAFLALPGEVGTLSTDGSAINEIDETDLKNIVCTARLAMLVRQEFPGYYERIPDDQLERSVLRKHPEYRGRLCSLPAWMDATPHEIIKYQLKPLPTFRLSVVLWSALATATFVVIALNIYFRLVVPPPVRRSVTRRYPRATAAAAHR